MSRFLHIEHDPVDQPAATDGLDRASWASLHIRVADRTVTRVLDRAINEERTHLYVPTFPIAAWIVANWWALLNEPCRSERVPRHDIAEPPEPQSRWIKRHCLQAAESGLLLPALYLFNDGLGLHAEWQRDEEGSAPHMPGEFVDSGWSTLDAPAAVDALARFVEEVLARIAKVKDPRAAELRADWHAIAEADQDERQFCAAVGRMGVDPYDPAELTEELAAFIESGLGDPDAPLARDLTEVAEPASVAAQWSWVQETKTALTLGGAPGDVQNAGTTSIKPPLQRDYELAREVRKRAKVKWDAPLESVELAARKATGREFRFEERNHVAGRGVRLLVGWSGESTAIAAGPRLALEEDQRFRLARGLHTALFSCQASERLSTDAFTADQQASRRFAAELLAPQRALAARVSGWADQAEVRALAEEYRVSTVLVRRQLTNAGVTVVDD